MSHEETEATVRHGVAVVTSARYGEIMAYVSNTDGAYVVEISTPTGGGQLRVYVNEGVVFDQSPEEHGPHGQCGYMWRDSEPHRCTIVGPHRIHRCDCCRATALS